MMHKLFKYTCYKILERPNSVVASDKKFWMKTAYLAMAVASGQLVVPAYAIPASTVLPSGGNVVSGTASFNYHVSNRLIINQATDKLITNWNSFDVGSGSRVSFKQPNSGSIALNRVVTTRPSEIFGAIDANGQVFLVNPNGITFGAGSEVRASNITASVFNINDNDFNAGIYLFNRGNSSTGIIENAGYIHADSGSVNLLASHIDNKGIIVSRGGDIAMLNADRVQLPATTLAILQPASIMGIIQSSGRLEASQVGGAGGQIVLQAGQAAMTSNIALSGEVKASRSMSASASTMDIGKLRSNADTHLDATSISVHGTFNLAGDSSALDITGDYRLAGNSAKINLLGFNPSFTADGVVYTIIKDIGQLQAIGDNAASLAGHYVLAANINAVDTSGWNSGAGFKPIGSSSIPFSGVLDGLGHAVNGLRIRRLTESVGLIAYAKQATVNNVTLRNASMIGDSVGGLIFSSEHSQVDNSAFIGHVLTIVSPAEKDEKISAGLVGINEGGIVSNSTAAVNILNRGLILASSKTAMGGLVGINNGLVSNSNTSGSLTSNAPFMDALDVVVDWTVTGMGGLVGKNHGTVAGSHSAANVFNSFNQSINIGGLVGFNDASVMSSYASGDVQGGVCVGGLIGRSFADLQGTTRGLISNSYASGNVRSMHEAGGLIGGSWNSVLNNTYATGKVYASGSYEGGLVGLLINTDVKNSYWDKTASGTQNAFGRTISSIGSVVSKVEGLSTAQIRQASSFSGWDISTDPLGSSIWYIDEGTNPPVLR